LAADYDKFKAAAAAVLAISVDPPEKSRELAQKLNVSFPLLSDPEHKVIDRYDVLDPSGKFSIASVFLVDKKGIVRWSYVADDYKVRPLDEVLLAELAKIKES
jgi:peroxiredoxin Q/BCP